MSKRSSSSSSSSRTPTKRILTELSAYSSSPPPSIPFLAPSSSSNLFQLSAILSGAHLPSPSFSTSPSPYRHGRWLISLTLPANYPNSPPVIRFETKICHVNVDFKTGEVCLDVLKEHWTPVLGIVGALESIGRLLGEPGTDSPLGVEVASLVRNGDTIGAGSLVRFWCEEERWEGGLPGEEHGR